MSFFGKKYQKVDIENVIEFMDALKLSDKVRLLLRKTDALASFNKNPDGTIQYTVESDGTKLIDQKITLDKELDFTLPDGLVTKNKFTLEGDTLKASMTDPEGRTIYFNRQFDGDKMKMDMWATSLDVKATVHYQAV